MSIMIQFLVTFNTIQEVLTTIFRNFLTRGMSSLLIGYTSPPNPILTFLISFTFVMVCNHTCYFHKTKVSRYHKHLRHHHSQGKPSILPYLEFLTLASARALCLVAFRIIVSTEGMPSGFAV